jgi:hypothetical protein
MKREVGTMAGLMAVFALVIHTFFPTGQEGGGTPSAKAQEKKGAGRAGTSNANALARPDGPWLATQAFFNSGPSAPGQLTLEDELLLLSPKRLPDETQKVLRAILGVPADPDSYQVWTIVATIADPVHTRFPLFFDAQIESIERAAAIQGWEFSGQWLPWRDTAGSSADGAEEHRNERRLEREQEDMPGVLIFRRAVEPCGSDPCFPNKALFVFLVPETPTKGVAGNSLTAALNLASVLAIPGKLTPARQIGLLAPTFSGSFESLARSVESWHDNHKGSTDIQIHPTVYGGSISSDLYANAFQVRTGFTFNSGIASSKDYRAAFEEVLRRYKIDPEKAAYWIEDESGYASSFQAEEKKPTPDEKGTPTYTFPREISHLRNAYQEATKDSRNSSRNSGPSLDISLRDPSHGEDSIPVFSDTHTPLAQSAAISTITEEFRREGTQIVFILATNTLDALLLARFVRNESPDTRVLIADADILFIPAASQDSLVGTLFLSTYPMFILGQEWLTRAAQTAEFDPNGLHLVFPGPNFQGIFNVTQLLLAGIQAPSASRPMETLYGYRPLVSASLQRPDVHPGLWLLSLTHYGFLPLDWLPVPQQKSGDKDGRWFQSNSNSKLDPAPDPEKRPCSPKGCTLEDLFPLDPPSRGWHLATGALSLLILAGCFVCVKHSYSEQAERDRLRDGYTMRLPALLGAGLSASAALWILVLPEWQVSWWPVTVVAALALLAPIVSVAVFTRPLRRKEFKWQRPDRIARIFAVVSCVVFAVIAVEWFMVSGGISAAATQRALLFRLRAGQLFSDSVEMPLFLLSLIFIAGFLLYFRRYTEAADPRSAFGRDHDSELAKRHETINAFITAPFGLTDAAMRWRFGICIPLVGVVLMILWPGMAAFEIPYYNGALCAAIGVMLLSLATATYDLVVIWHNLRKFLARLESQPYPGKAAIERVTQGWPRRPIAFWKLPEESTPPRRPGTDAEQLCTYIIYAVRQTQRIAWSSSLGLLTLIAVLTAYTAQAPQLVGRFVAVLFLVIGSLVIWVFAGMERNWTLSRIARTEPGELNFEFWMQATAAIALPFIGVLIHLFPSIGGFVSSWVAPSLEALR